MTTEHEKEIESFGANNDFWIFGYGYVNHCAERSSPFLHSLPSLIYTQKCVCVCVCVCVLGAYVFACMYMHMCGLCLCVTWANSLGVLFFRLK